MKVFRLLSIAALLVAASPQFAAAAPPDIVTADSCTVAPLARMTVRASVASIDSLATVPATHSPIDVLGFLGPMALIGFAVMGSINNPVSEDRDSYPARGQTMAQLTAAIRDIQYFMLHHPMWQVAAAAVAPPVINIATETKTVKTTATTQLLVNGVVKSLTATDPIMVLANMAASDPNTLAIGSVRRWQLCWDATDATTVITLRPSNDKVIASYGSAALALAACRWPSLPPAGTVIVGLINITNITNVFTPGTTILSAAGVTCAYIDGPDANCYQASPVTP